MGPCVSQNQKKILAKCVWLKKTLKKGRGNRKKSPWAESRISILILSDGIKLIALKLLPPFLRYIGNVNLLFKNDFKSAELLTKTSIFFYFRGWPKIGEWSKGDVKSISTRVTKDASKRVAKAEVNLNCSLWIDYEQMIMNLYSRTI